MGSKQFFHHDLQNWHNNFDDLQQSCLNSFSIGVCFLEEHRHTNRSTTACSQPCFELPLSDAITTLTVEGDVSFLFYHHLFSVSVLSRASWQTLRDLASHLDITTQPRKNLLWEGRKMLYLKNNSQR